MKLPVIIQKHPELYSIEIPDGILDNGTPVSHEDLEKRMSTRTIMDGAKIPESWRKPCKLYSGFVYGLEAVITAEGDTEEEVIEILHLKLSEHAYDFTAKAREAWPQYYNIREIEI